MLIKLELWFDLYGTREPFSRQIRIVFLLSIVKMVHHAATNEEIVDLIPINFSYKCDFL